ncbi:MAG: hypothetical protein WC435_02550 [Candidatus Paceibacterota bacterium]
MRKIIKTSSLLLAILGLFSFSNFTALAAEKTCNEQIEEKLNNLLLVKDDLKLSEEKKSDLEFEAKKILLDSIISCSGKELEEIKSELNNLKKLGDEDGKIREVFLLKIDEFFKFFEEKNNVFKEIKDDREKIKELAKEILDWRQNVYSPLIKKVVNFTYFFKQKNIIGTAEVRLAKISSSLKKMLSIENKEINNLLSSSSKKISAASELNNKAYSLINEDFKKFIEETSATSTPDALISNQEVKGEDKETSEKTEEKEEVKPEEEKEFADKLIKESLDKIKEAYQDFFKVSKSVEKILGF